MPSYQLRDTTTRQLLVRDLADHPAAEAALDRIAVLLDARLSTRRQQPGGTSRCS